jgi:hypothetical protein
MKLYKKLSAVIIIGLVLLPHSIMARDKLPNEKSMPIGVLLGLSPISGDGLFYSGHPIQGGIALGIQLAGIIGGITYVYATIEEEQPFSIFASAAVGGGIILATSISTFLWDAIATPIYIHKHNEKIRRSSFSVAPTINYSSDKLTTGLQMKF